MSNKTLLIIFPSQFRGGTEEYALLIGSKAVKQGWNVHAAFPETLETVSVIKDFISKGVTYHPLKIDEYNEFWLETKRRHLLRFIRTVILLNRLKPNVVQLNLPYLTLSPATLLACAVLNIPTAVVFHLTPQTFVLGQKRLKAYSWAKGKNQQWIAVSEYNRRMVCETFQMSPQEVLRIYNGTRIDHLIGKNNSEDRKLARFQIRQELGLFPGSRLLLTVGRLHSQKGYEDIIPVITHIVKETPMIKFLWVGEGEYRNFLMTKVREYRVEDYVMFLGHRNDILQLLHAADLFVFPTHYEGLPFALIEAMAAGLPIIASDATSIPEIIEHGKHGLLFRTGDCCSLLETLRWALNHPEEMQEISQKATLRAYDFTQKNMFNQTLNTLQKLYLAKYERN